MQRAEILCVLVALQGCFRVHVGVDNLIVVNHVSRILVGRCTGKPFSLITDGDLLLRVPQFVRWRGLDNAAVSKVKGHADESLVALGRVREVDRIGNNEADAAAALGWRRVHHSVTCARGLVTRSCARWYPIFRELHRFFIAIARSVLNDDGMSGTTLHPVVWSAAANLKRRRVERGVGNVTRLPGPVHLWTSDWYQLPIACISEGDVAAWPFSVGLLLKICSFFSSLHWPRGAVDLGVGGISYLELLILYEKWAGERLVIEGAVPLRGVWGVQFQCRLFRLVQALILGALAAFWRVLSGFLLCYLVGCLGFCPVTLVLIIAEAGMWAGRSVGMGLLPGPGKRRILSFWIPCLRSLVTL